MVEDGITLYDLLGGEKGIEAHRNAVDDYILTLTDEHNADYTGAPRNPRGPYRAI